MLKKLKRCLTAFIAAAVMASAATGCTIGKNTANAMTIDGYELKAGIYILYQNSSLEEAKSKAAEENEELDTTDEEALRACKIEGKDFLDWVNEKTMEKCLEHVTVIKKFDELKLTLEDKDLTSIDNYADSVYAEENDSNVYYLNGIGKDSFKEVLKNSYRSNAIFDALYGEGGSEGVKEDELKEYYLENNARVKYVALDLHDTDGNELDDAGKKEMKQMADDYLAKVRGKRGEELLTAFDEIKADYDDYVSKKTAEANGESTEEETTEAETTEAATTETTVTTATEEETTSTDSSEDSSEAESKADTEESSDAAESEESAATDESSSASDSSAAETTAPADDSSAAGTTTTTVTTAPEAETTETEETTTTDPYANESIIPVVTTEEGTKEEDVNYTPSKAFYDWVYKASTQTEAPAIIEDEDNAKIYVAVKLELKDRMTSDDLWSEDNIESVRFSKYNDALQDKIDEWSKALEDKVEPNETAKNRYKAFNYKQPETTAAK